MKGDEAKATGLDALDDGAAVLRSDFCLANMPPPDEHIRGIQSPFGDALVGCIQRSRQGADAGQGV